jgi:hypothetical protein
MEGGADLAGQGQLVDGEDRAEGDERGLAPALKVADGGRTGRCVRECPIRIIKEGEERSRRSPLAPGAVDS